MRFYEISSGVRVPVDTEEQALLDKAVEARSLLDSDLDERQAEVARKMVSRGLLNFEKSDKGTAYAPNDCADLWRY